MYNEFKISEYFFEDNILQRLYKIESENNEEIRVICLWL